MTSAMAAGIAGNTDDIIHLGDLTMLPQEAVVSNEAGSGQGPVVPETVTVTLTQSPGEGQCLSLKGFMFYFLRLLVTKTVVELYFPNNF